MRNCMYILYSSILDTGSCFLRGKSDGKRQELLWFSLMSCKGEKIPFCKYIYRRQLNLLKNSHIQDAFINFGNLFTLLQRCKFSKNYVWGAMYFVKIKLEVKGIYFGHLLMLFRGLKKRDINCYNLFKIACKGAKIHFSWHIFHCGSWICWKKVKTHMY